MNSIYETVAQVKDKMLHTESAPSLVVLTSGVAGKSTFGEPDDPGHAPEPATRLGTEPASGQTGERAIDQPCDRGNEPAPENARAALATETTDTTSQPVHSSGEEASTSQQGSGSPHATPIAAAAEAALKESATPVEAEANESTSTGTAGNSMGAAAHSRISGASNPSVAGEARHQPSPPERGRGTLQVPAGLRSEDRSISPGTLPDGTHVQTSGDRGESYEPGMLNKLKGKLRFGKK